MFESSVEERYKNNATFRNLVDILRSELRRYNTTPRELREAAMLASTMHEAEHIRPMFIYKAEFPINYFKRPAMYGPATEAAINAMQPAKKQYPHNFNTVHAGTAGSGPYKCYYVCSKCGLSDTYVSTLENKTCEKF